MSESKPRSLGALLRAFRTRANASQEELAERAGIGVDTVSALERGVTTLPQRSTVERLVRGLQLDAAEAAALHAAATGSYESVAHGPRHNLPARATRLIGRAEMVREIAELVGSQRHVTLIGSGGIGKTSAAVHVGWELLAHFADGVWFVDFAGLVDARSAVAHIAARVGLTASADREALLTSLERRNLLLILDNCEHLVSDVAELAQDIRARARDVCLLATSQVAFRSAGEYVFAVDPLAYPGADQRLDAVAALSFGAIELFVERARAADRHFKLDAENVALVGRISRRVQGIALGIELAASRISSLGLANLEERLERQLTTLSGGRRTARPHHQTIRALIDWSYDLLSDAERVLLERVAIFAGGWTLEAAEHVCSGDGIAVEQMIDLLANLIEKSQIIADTSAVSARYRMLESVREYALEKLALRGARDVLAQRHADWVAAVAELAEAQAWLVPRRRWVATIMPELANIRTALLFARQSERGREHAGRIAASLGLFWYYAGLADEGRASIEDLLAHPSRVVGDLHTAKLWSALSALLAGSRRIECAGRAVALFERRQEWRRLAVSCLQLAIGYRQIADFPACLAAIDRALEIFVRTGDEHSTYYASALGWRASALIGLGRFDEARAIFENDIALLDSLEDPGRAAIERLNLAELEFAVGNVRRAIELIDAGIVSLELEAGTTGQGNDSTQVVFYLNRAAYRIVLGDIDSAWSAARRALDLARGVHYPLYVAIALQHLATVAALRGDCVRGARLRGFVNASYRREGVEREPTEARLNTLLDGALRLALTDAAREDLERDGAALRERDAVELVSG